VSLTTRLSTFFLAALALVLVGFSLTLLLLTHTYLRRQAEERLASALDTLAAAIEQEEGGLEWEPEQRHLSLGRDDDGEQPRWILRDDSGSVIDRSDNLHGADLPVGGEWLNAERMLQAEHLNTSPQENPRRYREMSLAVAVSNVPRESAFRNLAGTLAGLSALVWLGALLLGRTFCRHALAPVSHMAIAARSMRAADRNERLPVQRSGDELEDLGRAFNDLLARLEQSFERQRQFTGDASHQLRTPLTVMLGQVEVALRRERSAEDYRHVLSLLQQQAGHLRQIVEALLFLARTDAEAGPANLEVIDLGVWLPDHLRHWAEHPRAGDLLVEIVGDESFSVRAQPLLLGQMLDNLIDNALKYGDPDTPVTIRLTRSADRVLLAVSDAGGGIDPRHLPHVFEPFYRSPEAIQRGRVGIGLGLATAQRIAAVFGGEIVAASELGRGSSFTIRLPS
jgi:two-component system OmpR family sensor kinase